MTYSLTNLYIVHNEFEEDGLRFIPHEFSNEIQLKTPNFSHVSNLNTPKIVRIDKKQQKGRTCLETK